MLVELTEEVLVLEGSLVEALLVSLLLKALVCQIVKLSDLLVINPARCTSKDTQ